MKYIDFELRIERDGDAYRARVLNSPAGQASHSFELPLTRDRIELIIMKLGQVRRRAKKRAGRKSVELSAAREIGGSLYRAVFAQDVRACFRTSIERAYGKDDTGLRIKLRLDEVPELADLPWELLLDSASDKFVAQSRHTPIVRYLELPTGVKPAPVQPPLELLVMISSPIRDADFPRSGETCMA